MAAHVRKNDTVQVIAGKERGKSGKVLEVLPKAGRARVEKLMMVKRHLKRGRSQTAPQGGIIDEVGTINLSNLMLVCPKCHKPARTGRRELADGRRGRFCKKCDELVD
jgi:large subunit ribosomal protein L24